MEYKGYQASVTFDEHDQILVGKVVNVPHAFIAFDAKDVEQLYEEFKLSIDAYLEACEKTGRKPKKPFSGKMMIRTTPDIHSLVTARAKTEGISINKFVERAIIEHASH